MSQLPSHRFSPVDRTRRDRRQALLAALALAAAAFGTTQALAFGHGTLVIVTQAGQRHRLSVEIAATPAERAHGLMFREQMAPDHGMLFDFEQVQPVQMWMKNTKLPLDMLFIDPTGRIVRVAADTVPFSEDIIASGGPVRAVLELNAGTAKRLGIAPGDRVEHGIFKNPG